MSPQFSAYHGVTGSEHQNQFNNLFSQGYRIISLSVYGDSADPRYAAVWVKRDGPAWFAIHGINAAQYQAFFNEKTTQGFLPMLISVTGSAANPVFAGTFEQGTASGWLTKFGLTNGPDNNPSTFSFHNKWARENGFILRSASIYGDMSDRRYAAIWSPNTTRVQWASRSSDTAGDYQKWFDAYNQMPYRPAYVALSSDKLYLSLFRDDLVGEWVARHGLSSSEYQNEFNLRVSQGFYPICVQGGGVGNDTRYAVIFAKQETPIARQWTVTGESVASLAAFDAIAENFMKANNVRAGQLAIAKDGTIKFARAYTWAEPGYPITQTNSPMRLASCSKAFACAAIKTLFDKKKLDPTDKVFPRLGITAPALPTQTVDSRINTITVQHLLDHSGGWDRNLYPDPVFNMRNIARSLKLSKAPTKRDIARFMYGEPLQFDPGTANKYSNFGYVLLGLLVEQATGQSFIDYLKQSVLAPLGISDVFLARTLKTQRLSNEGFYDGNGIGLTSLEPNVDVLTPFCYGGEGWLTESMDTGGGLAATASAMTRFIHSYAVWGVGGRVSNAARSGSMAGVSSLAVSRGDGVDYVYIFNTRDLPSDALQKLGDALDKQLNNTKWS